MKTSIALVGLLSLPSFVGCCPRAAEPEPVFGGRGANVEGAKSAPLEGSAGVVESGPCDAVKPASEQRLIDDFEDADNQMFKTFQRQGWWYVAADQTKGQVFPPIGDFRPTALPENEATPENRYALYGKAEGYEDWGVLWGTTLTWTDGGIKCPLNGSKFEGVRFRAKGNGTLHVKFGNPDTVPTEQEGKCKERCWDTHGMKVSLTEEWQEFTVRYDRLQQGGWGTEAQFDPARLMHLNFSADGKSLPVEFWLDDLEFILPNP